MSTLARQPRPRKHRTMDARATGGHCVLTMRTLLAALTVAAACAAGCTSAPEPPPAVAQVPASRLDASVAQYRFDEGTRNLRAGVTNNSGRDIRVSSATIVWDGLAFPDVAIADDLVKPGLTAAFTIAYGAPRCSREPSGRPVLGAVIDGRTRRLPLRVEDPQLLVRLRERACAEARLHAAASVRLAFDTRTVMVRGEEYLPGRVVLTRRGSEAPPLRIVDIGGSVLVDFTPRTGRAGLPTALPPDRQRLSLDVLAGSAHRCDGHARGNSSQTFLLSVYVRLGRFPVQREIVVPTEAEQVRLLALIDRDCR